MAWSFTLDGERALVDECLGQRERLDDWLELRSTTGCAPPSPPSSSLAPSP